MVTEPKPSGYELSSVENERIFREQIIPHEMGNATRQAQPAASDMELLPTPPRVGEPVGGPTRGRFGRVGAVPVR